jgi:hypothetical protein
MDGASAPAGPLGKLLVIDLHADRCGPCRTLAEDYFADPPMREILLRIVLLRVVVDSDAGSAGQSPLRSFSAVATSISPERSL